MIEPDNSCALLGRFLNDELPQNRSKVSNCLDSVFVRNEDTHGVGIGDYLLVVTRDMTRIKDVTNDGVKGTIEELVLPTSEFLELIRAGN